MATSSSQYTRQVGNLSKIKSKKDEELTFSQVIEMGLVRLQLDPSLFWSMTWGEFVLACEGYYNKSMQDLDRYRRLLLMIRNCSTGEKDWMAAEDFWPLPIDPEYELKLGNTEPKTVQQYDDAVTKAQERLKRRPYLQKLVNKNKN